MRVSVLPLDCAASPSMPITTRQGDGLPCRTDRPRCRRSPRQPAMGRTRRPACRAAIRRCRKPTTDPRLRRIRPVALRAAAGWQLHAPCPAASVWHGFDVDPCSSCALLSPWHAPIHPTELRLATPQDRRQGPLGEGGDSCASLSLRELCGEFTVGPLIAVKASWTAAQIDGRQVASVLRLVE